MGKKGGTAQRSMFASRFGAIAATVGSAVGLGNIWRFPYEAGAHGGGMFLFFYVFFVLLLGVPLMSAEFVVGRKARLNATDALRKLAPGKKWYLGGYIAVICSLVIIGFYSVVAGWTLEYFWQSIAGNLHHESQEEFHMEFVSFSSHPWRPLIWTVLFLAINFWVLARGVTKGIEKLSNVLMPALFVILVIFCIYAATLPGYSEGITFFFRPDMQHFNSATILGALGQTFFSLSLGMGCMVTYGSYLPKNSSLAQTAFVTAVLGSVVAFLAGMVIFPAVFTFGISPQAGPALIYEVLPLIFDRLPLGQVWAILFFFLLLIATLSSTISISEIPIAYMSDKNRFSRLNATLITAVVTVILSVPCALSFGPMSGFKVFGMTVFDLFDYFSANIMMPLGGILISIFVGWVLKKKLVKEELTDYGRSRFKLTNLFIFIFRWLAPIAILIIFLNSMGFFPV